jgi:hypothetical protein
MKNTAKQICFLLFILILTLNCGDYKFIGNYFLNNQIETCCDFSEFPNHSCSHSVSCEDNFFMNDSNIKADKFQGRNDLVPILYVPFKNCFISDIWQPPKFS